MFVVRLERGEKHFEMLNLQYKCNENFHILPSASNMVRGQQKMRELQYSSPIGGF